MGIGKDFIAREGIFHDIVPEDIHKVDTAPRSLLYMVEDIKIVKDLIELTREFCQFLLLDTDVGQLCDMCYILLRYNPVPPCLF